MVKNNNGPNKMVKKELHVTVKIPFTFAKTPLVGWEKSRLSFVVQVDKLWTMATYLPVPWSAIILAIVFAQPPYDSMGTVVLLRW